MLQKSVVICEKSSNRKQKIESIESANFYTSYLALVLCIESKWWWKENNIIENPKSPTNGIEDKHLLAVQVKLCLFKTTNTKKWVVRNRNTLRHEIRKYSFIGSSSFEKISCKQMKQRLKLYYKHWFHGNLPLLSLSQ